MAEEETGATAPESAVESNVAIPTQIDPNTLAELFEDPRLADSSGAEKQVQTEQATEAERQLPTQEPESQQPSGVTLSPEQITNMQEQTAQAVARAVRSGQTEQQATKTVVDVLAEKNPDVPRESLEWMVTATETINQGRLGHMQSEIENLKRQQQQQVREATAQDYDSHLNTLAEQHGITSPFEREALAALTTKTGVEQHGHNFSKAEATRIYKNLTTKLREDTHNQNQQYVEKKINDSSNAPPITGSTSTDTANAMADQIRKGLNNPKDRSWDFRGDNFKKVMNSFLSEAEKKALG